MPFIHIRADQQSDFTTVLNRRNRSPDSFEINDTPERIAPDGAIAGPLVANVTVRSRTNGAARTYNVGPSITYGPIDDDLVQWVRDFATDLDTGVFG